MNDKTDRQLLELITAQVNTLTNQVNTLTVDVAGLKTEVETIKHTVIRIENEHGMKLEVLLNGYKL